MKTVLFKTKLNQRGDTLIEVVVATVIIGIVLLSAFNLGNRAFSLGQNAQNRSQAAQLMQSQAEELHALRDSTLWDVFYGTTSVAGSTILADGAKFHMEIVNGNLAVVANDATTGKWDPGDGVTVPTGLYDLNIVAARNNSSNSKRIDLTVTITWTPYGSGPQQSSAVYLHLSDPRVSS